MKKRILAIVFALISLFSFCSCTNETDDSSFCITFIDVGQGDAALIECDGQNMLIDGGDVSHGDNVIEILQEKNIQHLDILAVSHLHTDHIGGLTKVLKYTNGVDLTLSNSDNADTKIFSDFEHQLSMNNSKITIPEAGNKYNLGSATVEVVDVSADENNDSLVLMISYGDNKFLFTGDIEENAQTRISDKYEAETDEPYKIDLIKIPHHGSYAGTLYRFLRTFMPDYAIISVGSGNTYGHPHRETLDLLDSKTWSPKVFRTDKNGDIIVKSNGKEIEIETEKR